MSNFNVLFLPDINYEPGHWRPVMSIAKKLKEREDHTFNIKFLCTPECRDIVESVRNPDLNRSRFFLDTEIEEILPDLYPEGYSTLAVEKPEEAHSRIDHCLKIAEGQFDDLLKRCKPHLLIAGYFVSMEALLIKYRYNNILIKDENDTESGCYGAPEMKIMITTTYLRHPSEDPAITSLRFLTHHAQELSSRLMQAAYGSNEIKDIKLNGSFASIKEFVGPLENVVELITCPEELDYKAFKGKHRADTYYVEPCILDTNPVILKKDTSLIYASAGSRVRDYIDSAKKMFGILISLRMGSPLLFQRKLEMAVGYTLREIFNSNSFYNITIKEWADQVDCLKRANLAFIHGGLASIKECIYFGVPFVIVPMGKDQMDNALRVLEHKVGFMLMLDDFTQNGLSNAINTAEQNSDIKNNLAKMKKKFEEYEKAQLSIDYIYSELLPKIENQQE